jgi:hypothetical protein
MVAKYEVHGAIENTNKTNPGNSQGGKILTLGKALQ